MKTHRLRENTHLEEIMSPCERLSSRTLLVLLATAAILASAATQAQTPQPSATVYEGARVITGGGGVIDDAAFVVENGRFTAVGRRGGLQLPAGIAHVDLSGKTVMPTMVDLHGHIGFQNIPAGTMSKETFTRENLIDHLRRLAFSGVGAVVSIGDLIDRSDMKGGRTGWGDVPLRMREEVIPGAALFRTAGAGLAWPGSGAQGHPSRVDISYPVSTVDEAKAAVDDYVKMKPTFIKIWVDDRNGTKQTLTPALYDAVLAEAKKFGVPVAVHNVKQADAKELVKNGIEGWLHIPVRQGEVADDEIAALVKARYDAGDHLMWMTPSQGTAWMNTQGGGRPAFLDDPLLQALYSPQQTEQYWGDPLKKMTAEQVARAKRNFDSDAKSAMRLRAAGIRVLDGTDTGQTRFLIGYANHMDLESMVAMGMTPMETIKAATSDGAEIAQVNTGLVAAGRNADFIVLNANPLDNISNTRKIDKVYLRGEEVPRPAYAAKWRSQFQTAATK
jgi:imidazolonepropionase-like amidohydrolase